MRRNAHVQVVGRRSGGGDRYEGWVDGVPAIVRCEDATRPTSDVRSAFFGGQGLRAPFRPGVHHEARVWARVEPTRVLAHGVGPEGPYVALRRLEGVSLAALGAASVLEAGCVEAIAVHLLGELAALHSAGVLHRDLRADNVLVIDGRARIAGLEAASLDGCGPPRPDGPGSPADDLAAFARLLRWMLAGRSAAAIGEALGAALTALEAPEVRDRPAGAQEALHALGFPGAPPPVAAAPHPALLCWAGGAWAERLVAQGLPWAIVRQVDRAPPDRWTLAGIVARLLAGPRNTEAWLATSTLCWLASELVSGSDRDAYRAQAEEARARAGASWHPASRGVAALVAGGARVAPLCEAGLPRRAEALARREGDSGKLALAGWYAGDEVVVEEGLADADPHDLDAIRVAASRLLVRAPARAPTAAARLAGADAQLEAVRELCATEHEAEATRLASVFPEPVTTRARLVVALSLGERAEATGIARALAARGAWDRTVAATLVAWAPGSDPLAQVARRVLGGLLTREDPSALLRAPAGGAGAGDALADRAGRIWALVSAGHADQAAEELEALGAAAGPGAWRLLALEFVAAGRLDDARAIALVAGRRHPGDAAASAVEACLALLDGDPGVARRAAEHALAQAPAEPWGWLARAAVATWSGHAALARADLAAAGRAGADGSALAALEACVPPVE